MLDRHEPTAIVHAAAMPDLAACQRDPDRARRINVEAGGTIAEWASRHGCRLIFISTDQVFDGLQAPYAEGAAPNPVHAYGRSKVDAEQRILVACPDATIVRISLVYGESPTGRRSASEQIVNALTEGQRLRLFTDEYRTPVLVDDVAIAIEELLAVRGVPMLHLAGPDRVSRHAFGLAVAEAFGLDGSFIEAIRQCDVDLGAPRPPDLSLDTALARRLLEHPPRSVQAGLAELAQRAASSGGDGTRT
jgi:dTDP-4-dehydrorhamnose reductase